MGGLTDDGGLARGIAIPGARWTRQLVVEEHEAVMLGVCVQGRGWFLAWRRRGIFVLSIETEHIWEWSGREPIYQSMLFLGVFVPTLIYSTFFIALILHSFIFFLSTYTICR